MQFGGMFVVESGRDGDSIRVTTVPIQVNRINGEPSR